MKKQKYFFRIIFSNCHPAKTKTGFTLIELLVVIAIIGLLASVVMVSLNNARTKARDAKRRADLSQLSKALELYYNTNNAYPIVNTWKGMCPSYGGNTCGPSYNQPCAVTGANGYIPNLAPTFVAQLPRDPKEDGSGACYLYYSNGVNYKLLAHGTTESICPVPSTDPMYDAARAGQCTFTIFSSGGSSW